MVTASNPTPAPCAPRCTATSPTEGCPIRRLCAERDAAIERAEAAEHTFRCVEEDERYQAAIARAEAAERCLVETRQERDGYRRSLDALTDVCPACFGYGATRDPDSVCSKCSGRGRVPR